MEDHITQLNKRINDLEIKTIKNRIEYMNSLDSNDFNSILFGLHNLTLQNGGFKELARKTGLKRESLYKMFQKGAYPNTKSFLAILKAHGLALSFKNNYVLTMPCKNNVDFNNPELKLSDVFSENDLSALNVPINYDELEEIYAGE